MPGAITATTATTTTASLPMSLSSNTNTNTTPTSFEESTDSPAATMPSFTPGQCLFCPNSSPNFADSVVHMQKSHGLFIPHQEHLLVDLETLFRYLHLVIFEYRECLHCGTERATVQAVQQHMTGKGHCRFDISEQDSEFADFYDFSEPEDDKEADTQSDQEETETSATRKPLMADEDSILLPSGIIISRRSPSQAEPSIAQLRRRTRASKVASQLEYSVVVEEDDDQASGTEEPNSGASDTRLLSRREKRQRATVTYQMANMSANDRNALMHLPTSQQRSILAAQHRNKVKVQKEERRRQAKVDRKGNKNLYAYWATETPVYQCG